MAQPTGSRGSWYALWRGEEIPCIHKCWVTSEAGCLYYCDPGVSEEWEWPAFIEAIRQKRRVIMTDDLLDERGSPRNAKAISLFSALGISRLGIMSFTLI